VWQRLQPLLKAEIDTLVYGCTHYPHLAPLMQMLLPKRITLVDPAIHMATAAAQEIELLNLKSSQLQPQTRFCVSGQPEQFARASRNCLGFVPQVERVSLPGVMTPASSLEHEDDTVLQR
jgi:glutamate racemase